jgi:hypothetical protein
LGRPMFCSSHGGAPAGGRGETERRKSTGMLWLWNRKPDRASYRGHPRSLADCLFGGALVIVLSACSGVACSDPGYRGATVSSSGSHRTGKIVNASASRVAKAGGSVINPMQLVGLTENEIQVLLGRPSIVDENPPARTWRYRRGTCTLTLALYPDVQTRIYRALTYEVTSDDPTRSTDKSCRVQFTATASAAR